MDRPGDSQLPPPPGEQREQQSAVKEVPPTYRSLYLILYNFVSAILWSGVLGRVLLITALHGQRNVYIGTGEYVKWVQTLAGMEIVHAAIGLVRAPLFTTGMQVASRFLLVWGIVYFFPGTSAASPAYASMLLAWSLTEVIRYSYFAINLAYGRVPAWLTVLRYNTFLVLYPLGISSECWLVWCAVAPARNLNAAYEWVLKLVLFIYIPGSYILFTHMMAQRRKVMRAMRETKKTQ